MQSDANSILVGASLLLRYKNTPEYLRMTIDAKDRAYGVGTVLDVESGDVLDADGAIRADRWQVIEFEEVAPGEKAQLLLQSYNFVGKFAIIMENSAPNYAAATADERLQGCWMSDETTGLMPDGTDPYLIQ